MANLGHIIIVTKTGGAIDEDVTVIQEESNPTLYYEIVDLARAEMPQAPITFLWPTNTVRVTQAFGINPQWYESFGLPGHEGIDMRALDGTPIRAAWGGEVIGNYKGTAYGWAVKIKAVIRGDTYEMAYAHMKEQSKLVIGSIIQKGDFIGPADSTGNSTGSHLHFMLKKYGATAAGETNFPKDIIDPTNFFAELRD